MKILRYKILELDLNYALHDLETGDVSYYPNIQETRELYHLQDKDGEVIRAIPKTVTILQEI